MDSHEAREILWNAPKEQALEASLFDAMLSVYRTSQMPEFRYDELMGELVMGGGLTVDGETAPTFRYSRSSPT